MLLGEGGARLLITGPEGYRNLTWELEVEASGKLSSCMSKERAVMLTRLRTLSVRSHKSVSSSLKRKRLDENTPRARK